MDFKIEFDWYHLVCNNFDAHLASAVKNALNGSRMFDDLAFDSYGHIDFDENDKKHQYPMITKLDTFVKNNTNCLIFNLFNSDNNPGYYDKLFIYHSTGKVMGNYGFVLYNTKTNARKHKYFIYDELTNLLNDVSAEIISLNRHKYMQELAKIEYKADFESREKRNNKNTF